MLRTLLLTNDFPPVTSGIATYFFQLWRHLPADKVAILAPALPGSEKFDNQLGCRVIRKKLPIGESNFSKMIKMVAIAFWALIYVPILKISMLHCGQVLSTGLAGLLCNALFKTRYAVFVCGSESTRFGRNRFLRGLMNKILGRADKIIANSEHTKQEYVQAGFSPKRIAVATPGVDTDFFCPNPGKNMFHEIYDLNSNPVLLTVARLDERKGHDAALLGLSKIKKAFPDVRYLIAGTGREKLRLQTLAEQLGLVENVIFAGYVDDENLPALYNAADIFILPNRETTDNAQLRGDIEGFGIVFLEAAACAKPAIAGRNGGATEAVTDGVTGLLVDPENDNEIEGAILRLLMDSKFAQTLGQNGRKRCEQRFQWSYLAKKLEAEIL